jgi:hypothetical protein
MVFGEYGGKNDEKMMKKLWKTMKSDEKRWQHSSIKTVATVLQSASERASQCLRNKYTASRER